MIIETKCCLFDREEGKILGKDNAADMWAPFAFDMKDLIAIHPGYNKKGEEVETNVYFLYESFVVIMPYKDLLAKWRDFKKKQNVMFHS
jgi:hypothetical protein